jgi:hypothetical protein
VNPLDALDQVLARLGPSDLLAVAGYVVVASVVARELALWSRGAVAPSLHRARSLAATRRGLRGARPGRGRRPLVDLGRRRSGLARGAPAALGRPAGGRRRRVLRGGRPRRVRLPLAGAPHPDRVDVAPGAPPRRELRRNPRAAPALVPAPRVGRAPARGAPRLPVRAGRRVLDDLARPPGGPAHLALVVPGVDGAPRDVRPVPSRPPPRRRGCAQPRRGAVRVGPCLRHPRHRRHPVPRAIRCGSTRTARCAPQPARGVVGAARDEAHPGAPTAPRPGATAEPPH